MGVRQRMTMRANTERQVKDNGRSNFNLPTTQPGYPLTKVPCYWQSRTERFIADDQKVLAFATHLILMPLDSDIREQDFVVRVENRRGKVLMGERLRVVGAVNREDHIEVSCEAYT